MWKSIVFVGVVGLIVIAEVLYGAEYLDYLSNQDDVSRIAVVGMIIVVIGGALATVVYAMTLYETCEKNSK